MSAGFHSLEIAEVRRETAGAVSLLLSVPEELRSHFCYKPGQHISLRQDIEGEDVRRNYSICAAPHENELRVAIKQIEGGRFSSWANRELMPGHHIDVMRPHGSFTWEFGQASNAKYVGFAGGSGITPILSLMKSALVSEPDSQFTLFYGNRTTTSIMFLEEIANLKDRFMERLQVYHFLEDEEDDIELFNGQLNAQKVESLIGRLVVPAEIDAAFICGPEPMMEAVEASLKGAGLSQQRILLERFTASAMSEEQRRTARKLERRAEGKRIKITIDGRRRTVTFDAKKGSILESARAAGLAAPFACKAGVCATCRAKVVSGKVEMIQNYGLSAQELAQGYILTCQALPLSDDVELDYDA